MNTKSGPMGVCLGSLLLIGALFLGCAGDNAQSPPQALIHFPVAASLSQGSPASFLLVANSNFDLRYTSGTLQSYDLDVLNQTIDTECTDAGVDPAKCAVVPSELDVTTVEEGGAELKPTDGLLLGEVRIGSYADGLALSTDGQRAYLPIRSNADLAFVDLDAAGKPSCGGSADEVHTCTDEFRGVDRSFANQIDLRFPSDPVAIHVGSLTDFGRASGSGDYIVMAHRDGSASLMLDKPGTPRIPELVDSLDGLSTELVTVTVNPQTGIAWIPSANTLNVSRVGVAIGSESNADSFLFDAGPLSLLGIDRGSDKREVIFDPRPNVSQAYVASRSPEALLIYDTSDIEGELLLRGEVPVGRGASRLALAELDVVGGTSRLFAFVSCFNSRDVHIIDVDLGLPLTVISGVSGAFELVVDVGRQRLYVVDFRTSVIRIIDLDPMLDCFSSGVPEECSPRLIGLLGNPDAVQELR